MSASTLARELRSTTRFRAGVTASALMVSKAASVFSLALPAMNTAAPFAARFFAVTRPMPLLPPVIMTR